MTKPQEVDPITMEVIRYELISAAEEMSRTVIRTSLWPILYEIHDFAMAVYDARLNMLSHAPGIPVFIGTLGFCIDSCIEQLGEDAFREDDVILTTNPFHTGGHSADAASIAPVFHEDEIVAYTALKGHLGDFGSVNFYPTQSTDMWQEGTIYPAIKIYERGKLNTDILRMIRVNSRLPDITAGNLLSFASALNAGTRRVKLLVQKYGRDTFYEAVDKILDHGEQITRNELAEFPEGTWEAEDWMDDDGINFDEPLRLHAKVTIKGTNMTVDLGGSAPEAEGPFNSPFPATFSGVAYALKALTTPQAPTNGGHFRPLKVIAPEGSIFNPSPPAPTMMYFMTSSRLMELIPRALADALPEKVPANSGGTLVGFVYWGTWENSDRVWLGSATEAVGIGGSVADDGDSAMIHYNNGDCCNIPAEIVENRLPVVMERYSLNPDSGGPGKHRGGLGVIKEIRLLLDGQITSIIEKTQASPPWGLKGGTSPLKKTRVVVRYPDGHEEHVTKVSAFPVPAGGSITLLSAGGGGYGDPYEREIEKVHEDVVMGFVSPSVAKEYYGVVVDSSGKVDMEATKSIRKARLAANPKSG
ncbi:MAG: hydantoinase B/oxoprolinase family protein [Thermoplasmata archaeon]